MATEKQIAANQQNAKKSTGPKTALGKTRSRQNAYRHGLTAETMITILEHADEYTALEEALIAEYKPKTTIQHQLVTRLASLLWRLRRAVAIETGLFEIHGRIIDQNHKKLSAGTNSDPLKIFRNLLSVPKIEITDGMVGGPTIAPSSDNPEEAISRSPLDMTHAFLRLNNFNGEAFDRLSRYETMISRQIFQLILVIQPETRSARPSPSLHNSNKGTWPVR